MRPIVRRDLAERIADAVLGVPGVTRLVAAGDVEVSTQYAGGRVPGVRVTDDDITIRVAVDILPAHETAERIRQTVISKFKTQAYRPITVIIADIDVLSLPESGAW